MGYGSYIIAGSGSRYKFGNRWFTSSIEQVQHDRVITCSAAYAVNLVLHIVAHVNFFLNLGTAEMTLNQLFMYNSNLFSYRCRHALLESGKCSQINFRNKGINRFMLLSNVRKIHGYLPCATVFLFLQFLPFRRLIQTNMICSLRIIFMLYDYTCIRLAVVFFRWGTMSSLPWSVYII